MSLEAYSKVFFGPRVTPTPVEVKPSFLQPGKEKTPTQGDSFHGPSHSLKQLHTGKNWRPKSLARPSFLADKADTAKTGKKCGEYEVAKANHSKAEGEVEKAKAEYEKLENGAKAFKDLGNLKSAKLFSAKASVAKKTYEQKVLGAHLAKQKMNKVGAKIAKPATPVKGLAPAGQDLTGPSSATLAKNHSILSGKTKGVA